MEVLQISIVLLPYAACLMVCLACVKYLRSK